MGRFLALLAVVSLFAPVTADAAGMHGVFAKDATDVWAVGDDGLVYRSLDGGDTYAESFLGNDRLRAVAHAALNVLVVGDSGKVWRSTDNGGTWGVTVPAGDVDLWAVTFADDTTAYICGLSGTILKSTDAGASWSAQTSGTSNYLLGMTFVDASSGWVVGEDGTVRETSNGGGLWSNVNVGATHDLLDVAVDGSRVWVVGTFGQAYQSTNGGANWNPVNLRLDSMSDVFAVHLSDGTDVVLAGGGGFVRTSDDDGATWDFSQHTLQAFVSDFHAVGNNWWLATSQDEAVLRTTNAGTSWNFPTSTSVTRSWGLKLAPPAGATVRGDAFWPNPQNPNTTYCMIGSQVYVSRDLGETWQTQGNAEGADRTNSFVVSPKDSNVFVAAVHVIGDDRIVRSVNGGLSWTTELTKEFSEYGPPMEMDPDHPDTLFFGPENEPLWRSTDFGQNWSVYGTKVFRSPCDVLVVPESDSAVVLVGDGVTSIGLGEIWRTTSESDSFNLMHEMTASEVPIIGTSRQRNNVIFAASWSTPQPHFSTDFGLTWQQIGALSTLNSSWGIEVAKDDPNCVAIGQYGSARQTYLSFDGGTSYVNFTNSGNNYTYHMRDRALVLALQSTGIYKLNVAYGYTPGVGAQSIAVSAPNGGEAWTAGQAEQITWSASQVALAIIEYRTGPSEPWIEIAQVAGYVGSYDWTVPFAPTTQGRVRVRDGWDGTPSDTSNSDFDILAPAIAVAPDTLDFGGVEALMAATLVLTIDNTGTSQLDITDVTLQSGDFTVGRTAFSVSGGGNDTLGVTFRPTAVTGYVDTLEITHNAGDPIRIPLQGVGTDIPALVLTSPTGGEVWQYGTVQLITWTHVAVESVTIEFRRRSSNEWAALTASFPADSLQYAWVIPDSSGATARIRIRQVGATLADSTAGVFEIIVPRLQITPTVLNAGLATTGGSVKVQTQLGNVGYATLEITSMTSDDGDFVLDKSSASILGFGHDSLVVTFSPLVAGPDTATVTIITNGPDSPHLLTVYGEGTETVGVLGDVPLAFSLSQNRPNPFTGMTRIEYTLPRSTAVNLEVFDLQGKRVATLVREQQEPGRYSVQFGSGTSAVGGRLGAVRAGVYFYRLQAGSDVATRKMLLLN